MAMEMTRINLHLHQTNLIECLLICEFAGKLVGTNLKYQTTKSVCGKKIFFLAKFLI